MNTSRPPPLVEGVDYYMEGDKLVFTAAYHLKRGYCCNSKCRHCPYGAAAAAPAVRILGLPSKDPPGTR
jgi:hypothetical protein